MLKTGEIARRTGVSIDTIRHYTRMGLLVPTRDPANRYKLYSTGDVRRMRFILKAKQLGYTLKEIREIVHEARQGRSPCARVRALLGARIEENRRRIEALGVLQRRMEETLGRWRVQPDGHPDETSVCHLIEGEALVQ